jgi:hypothetical protein
MTSRPSSITRSLPLKAFEKVRSNRIERLAKAVADKHLSMKAHQLMMKRAIINAQLQADKPEAVEKVWDEDSSDDGVTKPVFDNISHVDDGDGSTTNTGGSTTNTGGSTTNTGGSTINTKKMSYVKGQITLGDGSTLIQGKRPTEDQANKLLQLLRNAANHTIRESDDYIAMHSAAKTYFYHNRGSEDVSTEQASAKASRLVHEMLDGNYENVPSDLLKAALDSDGASSSTTTTLREHTNWRRARKVVVPDTEEPATPVVMRKDPEPSGWVDYGASPGWVDYGNQWPVLEAEVATTWAQKATIVAPLIATAPRTHIVARCGAPMYVPQRHVNVDDMSIADLQHYYKRTQLSRMLGEYNNWTDWASVHDIYEDNKDTPKVYSAYPGLVMRPVALIKALSDNGCWCTAETAIHILFNGQMDHATTPEAAGEMLLKLSWAAHSVAFVHDNDASIKPAWNVYMNKFGMWTVHMHAITVRNYFQHKSHNVDFNLPLKYVPDAIKGKR